LNFGEVVSSGTTQGWVCPLETWRIVLANKLQLLIKKQKKSLRIFKHGNKDHKFFFDKST